MKVNKNKFKEVYLSCVKDILKVRPIDAEFRELLAKTNYAYLNYNFENYLEKSLKRCWYVYQFLPSPESDFSLLDIGGFFGNISLCLKRLGYKVTLAEVYDYYGNCFGNLVEFLSQEGISIINRDFTVSLPEKFEQYDAVLCCAVLEHIAHSPKVLLENIKKSLKKDGIFILEVPNIAYWSKRINLLRGRTILPPIDIIYKSGIPFMGHNHEYTKKEIEILADLAGFSIQKIIFFNYSMVNSFINIIFNLPAFLFNSCKEIILVSLKHK